MAFDVIVYNQDELLRAVSAGIKNIALCDNSFTLPDIADINYTVIGNVTIENADKPVEKAPFYASVENKTLSCGSSFNSSYGSYSGGGSGGSQTGSYTYQYEYEYGSFSTSYASSFASAYYSLLGGMSFGGGSFSFGTSYNFLGSYGYYGSFGFGSGFGFGSFGFGSGFGFDTSFNLFSSYGGSYALLPDIIEYGSSGIIFVNGYGINLI